MQPSQSIKKIMDLLYLLSKHHKLSAQEVVKLLDVHRSTAYRMLSSLESMGYVFHLEDEEKYKLTVKFHNLSIPSTEDELIKEVAVPYLRELFEDVNETVHLAVLKDDSLYYLEKIESTRSLKVSIVSHAGGEAPLYCTGLGKALLSGQPEERINAILKNIDWVKYTESTIATVGEMLKEIEKIRETGFAYDNEEHEENIRCIALPLIDANGKTRAAISITAPSIRMLDKRIGDLGTKLKKTVSLINNHLNKVL